MNARQKLILGGILTAAFAIRLIEALRRAVHTDERYSLDWASHPVRDMLEILRNIDVHPPLFFLFLHAFGLASAPLWVPRLVMVAFGTASVLVLFALVRLWAGYNAGIVAALCAAFMPSLVFYDTWIRMYVVSNFLGLLSFLLLSVLLQREDLSAHKRRLFWVAWTLCIAVGAYVLYLNWFFAAAQLLYVCLLRRDAAARAALGMAGAVMLWLPQLPTFLTQVSKGGVQFGGFQSHQLSVLSLLPGQVTFVPGLEGIAASAGALVAAVWIAISLWGVLNLNRRSLLPWLAAPALLILAYSFAAHKLILLDRYYLLVPYAVAAWTGCTVARLLSARSRAALAVATGALACLLVLGVAYGVDAEFYTTDWPAVSSTLTAQAKHGDILVLEQAWSDFGLRPGGILKTHPYILIWRPPDIQNAWKLLTGYHRVWLVAYQPRGVDPGLVLLDQLQKNYRLVQFYQFKKAMPAESVSVGLFVR